MCPWKVLIDTVAGAALALMLLVVVVVNGLVAWLDGPTANTLEVRIVTDADPNSGGAQRRLRLAVLSDPSHNPRNLQQLMYWDDMGTLLAQLGAGYQHDALQSTDVLLNPGRLDDYDVLFLTCAERQNPMELSEVLRNFVSRGGVLYASDWRYDAVASAFPDVAAPAGSQLRGLGLPGLVTADVVDPGLRELIGPTINLNFDMGMWKTAAFSEPRATVLMQGNYRKMRHAKDQVGVPALAPLLVRFPFGKGQVIFTSFHNEKQTSAMETKLLQYLVFTMVTAKVEAEVEAQIKEGGFAAQRPNLLSTPKSKSETKTFQNPRVGPLRVALGFRNEGARLRLQLRSPTGKNFTWEGAATVVLEVPHAEAGEWTFTITALEVPYENFPYILTVGEKR